MLMYCISYWFTAVTKHSDKLWGKEEKSKRGGDKWESESEGQRERERERWMECVDVADSAGTLPFPSLSLSLSFPPLWPTPLLQSHGTGLKTRYCRGRAAASIRAQTSYLWYCGIQSRLYVMTTSIHHDAQSMQSILKPSRGWGLLPYAAGLWHPE